MKAWIRVSAAVTDSSPDSNSKLSGYKINWQKSEDREQIWIVCCPSDIPVLTYSKEVWREAHKRCGTPHLKQIDALRWRVPAVRAGSKTVFWKQWFYGKYVIYMRIENS